MRRKNFIKIIIIIIFVAIIGLVSSLLARVWDPLWNPFRPAPAKVLLDMSKKMDAIKTLHSEIDFAMIVKHEKEIKIDGKFLTDYDNTEKENPKSKGNFNLSLVSDGTSLSFAGDNIAIGQTSFLKLTTIPAILEPWLHGVEINFTGLKNRWIKIDPESISDLLKGLQQETGTLGMVEMLGQSIETQKEMQEKLKNSIMSKQFFLVKKELPDEKIGHVNAYHYLLVLNISEVKNLIPDIIDNYFEMIVEAIPEQYRPSQEEIEREKGRIIKELEKRFDEFFEKMGEIAVETWIGKKDLLLYKLKIEKELNLPELLEEKGTITIKINTNLSKFGEIIEIKEPEEFKTIGGIFEEIFAPAIRKAQSKTRDKRRKADIAQLRDLMEFYRAVQDKYLPSKTLPTSIKMDSSVVPIPQEPGSGPCSSYGWLSNLKNPQKFCAWACLENGQFYAVSHKGTRELEEPPLMLDCW